MIKLFLPERCFSKEKTESQKIYQVGQNMVKNEMNMFTLLETMMKIKASLTVLVGDSHDKIVKIQNLYLQEATITTDEKEKEKNEKQKSEFLKFLERDERDTIDKEIKKRWKRV